MRLQLGVIASVSRSFAKSRCLEPSQNLPRESRGQAISRPFLTSLKMPPSSVRSLAREIESPLRLRQDYSSRKTKLTTGYSGRVGYQTRQMHFEHSSFHARAKQSRLLLPSEKKEWSKPGQIANWVESTSVWLDQRTNWEFEGWLSNCQLPPQRSIPGRK